MEFNSKSELVRCCANQVVAVQALLDDSIEAIVNSGMQLTFQVVYCFGSKHYSHPKGDKGMIGLCLFVFPKNMKMKNAIEQSLCRKIFVSIGRYCTKNDRYYLKWRRNKEATVRRFLNDILIQAGKYGVNGALRVRITDLLNNIFCLHANVNCTEQENKSRLLFWLTLAILLVLLLFRMLIPSGYHLITR